MLPALFLSIGQLGDKRIVAVFLKSFLLTLIVLGAIGVGAFYGVRHLLLWLHTSSSLANVSAGIVLLLGALHVWILFRAVAIASVGIFADQVVDAVEARHYPAAAGSARDLGFARSLAMGLGSALRTIGANLLLLPLYLILIVTGVGTPIAFFLVNAWLLGRDLGDMVGARHLDRDALRKWRGRTFFRRFLLGALSEALLLVPFVNLAAPVLSAAMAAHLYHRGRAAS
jgi:uncharacterized protein involved in cysteine biosynthesis